MTVSEFSVYFISRYLINLMQNVLFLFLFFLNEYDEEI